MTAHQPFKYFPYHPETGRPLTEAQFGYFWGKEVGKAIRRDGVKPRKKPLQPNSIQERVFNMLTDAPISCPAVIAERLGLTRKQVRCALTNLKAAGRTFNKTTCNGNDRHTRWGRVHTGNQRNSGAG